MFDPSTLDTFSPVELHARRRTLVEEIAALPGGHEAATTETLQELAFITGAIRRKNAGPPRTTKPTKRGADDRPKPTASDIDALIN
jgi:hypothetical protein